MFRRVSRCVRGSGMGWRVYPTRGYSAHAGRTPQWHKNGKQATVTRGRPAFWRHETRAEGSDTTPMQKCQNNTVCKEKNPLNPDGETSCFSAVNRKFLCEGCCSKSAQGFPFTGAFITSVGGGQHRICLVCGEAAALPNALGGAKPCAQIPGGSPDPLKATIGEKHEKRYQIQHAHGVR